MVVNNNQFLIKAYKVQFFIFLLSVTTLGLALLSQTYFNLYPCTYCILARIVISVIALFSLLSFSVSYYIAKNSHKFHHKKADLIEITGFLFNIISLLNIFVGYLFASKHYKVVAQSDFSCGIDELQEYLNSLLTAKIWPSMYEATGNCMDANYRMFNFIDYIHLPVLFYTSALFLSLLYCYYMYKNFFQKEHCKISEKL